MNTKELIGSARGFTRVIFRVLACSSLLALIPNVFAADVPQVPAFPGAEGYGAATRGGRGGKVIAVTNLDPSGPGSLRAACEADGPRIVVFRVAGTIDADVTIAKGNLTIAGQTAPGDGITLKGKLVINADDIIIRYLRVRAEGSGDAVSSRYRRNIILDHVTASWSSDEVLTIYHGENVTIQWSMITEACSGSHKFGGIWGNNRGTYHHNLFAHNFSRNPRFASGSGYNDFRNNVIYNWQHQSVYGGEAQQPTRATSAHERNKAFNSFSVNLVANYFKPGPGTQPGRNTVICAPWSRQGESDYGDWYLAKNFLVGSPEITADNWKGVIPQSKGKSKDLAAIPGLKLEQPSEFKPINQQTAEAAYEAVLKYAGCSLPRRDVIDQRIIEEVRTGTASKGDNGFVSDPSIAGGWPTLSSGTAPADTDQDGMPDDWEIKHGLNPKSSADGASDQDSDGYPNLEEYLNGTDPAKFVDYSKAGNNFNPLHQGKH